MCDLRRCNGCMWGGACTYVSGSWGTHIYVYTSAYLHLWKVNGFCHMRTCVRMYILTYVCVDYFMCNVVMVSGIAWRVRSLTNVLLRWKWSLVSFDSPLLCCVRLLQTHLVSYAHIRMYVLTYRHMCASFSALHQVSCKHVVICNNVHFSYVSP